MPDVRSETVLEIAHPVFLETTKVGNHICVFTTWLHGYVKAYVNVYSHLGRTNPQ